ncbi:hypothetical protein B0H11DRAFT_2034723 [Mycena galericulata]|nr:hypothetical protein B0H11DRAFT_2034723 [Mycena galericulata]
MGSMSGDFEGRLVPATLCACATILVYDLMCTLDQEILYVWPRPWSISTVLYVLNRYLPFIDTFIGLSAKFTRISPEQCLIRNVTVGWLSVGGIMLSEGILMLRTYAIWERKPIILILLCSLAIAIFVPMVMFVRLETKSLIYIPTEDGVGCLLSSASNILIFGYLLIMVSETVIAVLTAVKAYRDLRRSRVPWILKLYQDGMLFYVYLLMISIANVLVPILGPSMFANWLATPQRVLHSVLCTRVLLLILRQRRVATSGGARTTASTTETAGSGMIFSSVIDGNGEESDLGLATLESGSSRRVYAYPVSPEADNEEGRTQFDWPL